MNKEIKIGLFTILMILAAWAGVRFLKGSDVLSNYNHYYAHYEQINGVQESSSIYVRGVKIGSVTEIALDPSFDGGVTLRLSISSRYRIPMDSKAKIFSNGIMGSKGIEITWGVNEEILVSGDEIISTQPVDLMDKASSELDYYKDKLDTITTELESTLTNLNSILSENATHISGVAKNLDELTLNLNRVVESNESGIARTVDNVANLTETLNNNRESIDSIILNLNNVSSDLNSAQIGSSLTASLDEISTLMAKINGEEGSLSRILSDESLYENLSAASADLDALLIDMKENPKRYVHFSVFGRSKE